MDKLRRRKWQFIAFVAGGVVLLGALVWSSRALVAVGWASSGRTQLIGLVEGQVGIDSSTLERARGLVTESILLKSSFWEIAKDQVKPRFGFDATHWFITFPICWLFAPLLFFGWKLHRASSAELSGECPICGYDLRATPERCPECGTLTAMSK